MADHPIGSMRRRDFTEHLRPHDAVETGVFGVDVRLYDRRVDVVHELNSSASAVWLLIDGDTSVQQLVSELVAIAGVPHEQIETLVHDSIARFDSLGVLDGSAEPDGLPAFEVRVVAEPVAGREVMARPPDP